MPIKSIELSEKNSEYRFLEEETFEEEGNYEELLAYDNREDEYLLEHNKRLNINKRRRRNLPPVTPKAAMKDLVLNLLFDLVWSEIIDWSSNTIKRYAKLISTGVNDSIEHSTPLINDKRNEEIINEDNANPNSNNNNQAAVKSTNNNKIALTDRNGISNNNNNKNISGVSSNQNSFPSNILILSNYNNNHNNQEKQFGRKTNVQNIHFNGYVNSENIDTIQPLPPSRDSTFYVQSNKITRNHSSFNNENIANSVNF